MAEFALAGFPGCIGSMDASHVCLEHVEFRLTQPHLANKLHTTARSYNIVTNHHCRILSTTEGHPATWNDKTLVVGRNYRTNDGQTSPTSDLSPAAPLFDDSPYGAL
jgi:hypothetical protein